MTSLVVLALGGAEPAPAQVRENATARACLAIESVSIFRPRGEVYVEIASTCTEADFAREDPILAYLEVLLSDLPPESQDIRIYSDSPQRRQTVVFRELTLEKDQQVLVRLIRFGEILGLRTLKVP